jgi:hypothetical protein
VDQFSSVVAVGKSLEKQYNEMDMESYFRDNKTVQFLSIFTSQVLFCGRVDCAPFFEAFRRRRARV